ncbi:MAG: aldose epimerase family protein [Bacteroidales bacterium]
MTPPSNSTAQTLSGLFAANFQTSINEKKTDLFILKNKHGVEVCITNFGGRIVSVMVPDKDNAMKDVVLGFDNIQDYIAIPTDFGATIGRYANRIKHGKITLDGVNYQLPQNNNGHCLHGGISGFHNKVFDAQQLDAQTIQMQYLSQDGEEGFPGNLTCKITFTLTEDNAIDICYSAETDRTTVINLTNHSYFNLDGDATISNANYLLMIDADTYTPIDNTSMTTGEIASVNNTPMDFRKPTPMGLGADSDFEQIKNGSGYDHNWVLNTKGDYARKCARLESPQTGIVLDVYTNEPGMQVYGCNFLDGTIKGKKGTLYGHRSAVCLEVQKYPDTPNKPNWPSATLKAGEKYNSRCIYKFSINK